MGDGNVGIADYLRTYIEKCPGRPMSLEIIVTPEPRIMKYHEPGFWDAYRHTPAWEFARYVALADSGKQFDIPPSDDAVAREREDVEASLRWTKDFLRGEVSQP
jgi:hypothetical protein